MKKISILLMIFFLSHQIFAQKVVPDKIVTYKNTPQKELTLHIFYSEKNEEGDNRPVIIHFFGGGWKGGTPTQFYQQCNYFKKEGIVAISADYRVMKDKGITPFDCVEDARDAIRYLRNHAKEFGINPNQIIASGGSAGGHVALCTAVFAPQKEKTSSVPNALVLYNPVLDTSPNGYGHSCFKDGDLSLSPNHHIHAGLPPTIIFHGTNDHTVPFANAQKFEGLMKSYNNECILVPFEGEDHGFFNGSLFRKVSDLNFNKCIQRATLFLKDKGFIKNK